MTVFRVWAPRAGSVELEAEGQRVPMAAEAGGWWRAALPGAKPGVDYAFRLDGGEALPDPRSPRQPSGVHGPSRVVDHRAFAWSDASWRAPCLASAVIYEIHIGTFTAAGTFDAAIERLDHLVRLGVTHVELMPVAAYPGGRGWGYDGVALYATHESYGGPEGLRRLVDACHARGLAVILDVVYNHLGPSGNYLDRFGPYFTDRHTTPWGRAVNLDDADSDEVRRFFIDNALGWLGDYHMDGLRLDAVHAMLDTSALHFLEQLVDEVEMLAARLGRPLVLIAESNRNDPRLVRSREAGGYGLDAVWNDDFHHAAHTALTGERRGYYADFGGLTDLSKALREGFVYDGRHSRYRRRRHGRPATGLAGHRFIAFLQNHDQVGNRAQGERLPVSSLGRLWVGAALLLTSPFVPLLFQGEEWGATAPFLYFTDHDDPALAQAVRDGRRQEFAAFGWKPDEVPDPQAPETFARSKLDWSELQREPHAGLLEWHRALIRLRREVPSLSDGRMDGIQVAFDEPGQWLFVRRGAIAVACNLAGRPQRVRVGAGARVLLSSKTCPPVSSEGIELPPDSAAIVEVTAAAADASS